MTLAAAITAPTNITVAAGTDEAALGAAKLLWFRILKNSARNCNPSRSRSGTFLTAERSKPKSPGPVSESRETLPKVPAAGCKNACGLKYWLGLRRYRLPLKAGFQLGRTGLRVSPLPVGL